MGRHQQHLGRERGSATAEFAICLPAVLVVVLLVLTLAAVSLAQLRCADAARAGARAAALGEEGAAVSQIAAARAGPDAWVEVRSDGEWVTVRVGRPVLGSPWGTWQVVAEFAARVEPTAMPALIGRPGPTAIPVPIGRPGSTAIPTLTAPRVPVVGPAPTASPIPTQAPEARPTPSLNPVADPFPMVTAGRGK